MTKPTTQDLITKTFLVASDFVKNETRAQELEFALEAALNNRSLINGPENQVMDWHTRKVVAWRISNTLEAEFCVDALNEAIRKSGPPEIMNTDQGSQFTSFAWTDRLRRSGVGISVDGKGRFLDNTFVERLWRSPKYECVYMHAWVTGSEAKAGVRKWIDFYNHKRSHSALGGQPLAVINWQRKDATQPDQQVQRVA